MEWGANHVPLILVLVVCGVLSFLAPRFRELDNLVNILIQSSALAVVATGMTLVLLTAGVDLSVGSVMFVAVAVTGKLMTSEVPLWLSLAAGCAVGLLGGFLNGIAIVRLRVIPFIATLAFLYIARGFGLWLTNTRAINMPDSVTSLGAARWLLIPVPVWCMFMVVCGSQWFLSHTPWGRQIFAVGHDLRNAKKGGIRVAGIQLGVYAFCGFCAGLSGVISLTQTGAVSPSFGQQRELAAIAAAVLGGTSLFGGRGSVFPGTLFGAILLQTIDNGLVILNANVYLYRMIVSAVILTAVVASSYRPTWR
jgi:ribose transport system permease protein